MLDPEPHGSDSVTHLAEMLKLYRAVHHQSLKQLATEIGIDFNALARFERGQGSMSAEALRKLVIWLLSEGDAEPEG